MTADKIASYVDSSFTKAPKFVSIRLKDNHSIIGCIVFDHDYQKMKQQNLWKVVKRDDYEKWSKSSIKEFELTEIIHGDDILSLTTLPSRS